MTRNRSDDTLRCQRPRMRGQDTKGARRMPVAREGDEGRGKLRKARGRRKRSLIPGFPNGATRQSDGLPSTLMVEANLGN